MPKKSRALVFASVAAVSALTLAGCSGSNASSSSDEGEDMVTVVASTNVYGQIAEEIAGDTLGESVNVESIIDSASQDPHEYEASASDQLVVKDADLIIENGGGYDSFMDAMIESTGTDAHVMTAAESSHDWPESDEHSDEDEHSDDEHSEDEHSDEEEHSEEEHSNEDHADEESEESEEAAHDDHDHEGHDHIEGFNEHVWYDPHTMIHVAEHIAEELAELDPDNAETFAANLDVFTAQIEELEASLAEIAENHGGEAVFMTEPVGAYLVVDAGLENVTPDAFSEAVEEGQDVAPATLLEATTIIESGDVAVLIANAQTGGAETTQMIGLAEEQEIPLVEFTETLPDGDTYVTWMQQNIADLAAALDE